MSDVKQVPAPAPVPDATSRGRAMNKRDVESIMEGFALPPNSCATVRRVVKQSKLWRREKLAVAMELSAHFRDGLDAGTSEAELIKAFGDPVQAAKLIRRAKVRCRPMLWQIQRRTLQAIAAFVLLYVGLALFYAYREPVISVNYLRELNAPAEKVAANDRAWPLYRQAVMDLGLLDSQATPESIHNQIRDAYEQNKPITPAMRDWLRGNESSLQRVRLAAAKPGLGYVHRYGNGPEDFPGTANGAFGEPESIITDPYAKNEPVVSVLLPYLGSMRSMTRLLAVDASLAAEENDTARMNADLLAMDGIARHCYESPILINALVGHSIRNMVLKSLAGLIVEHPARFSDQSLQEITHRLSRWDFREPILNGFAGERAMFADMVQRTYSDDGNGNGRITKTGIEMIEATNSGVKPVAEIVYSHNASQLETLGNELRFVVNRYPAVRSSAMTLGMPVIREMVADRHEIMQKYDQVLRYYEALLRKNHRDIPKDDPSNPWKEIHDNRSRNLLINSIGGEFHGLGINSEQGEVTRDGVLLGIALTLYHRKEGRYPATLAELSPRYLPVLPVDPMTGEALRYRVTENGPIVYGVGTNHKDDGGVATPKLRDAWQWRIEESMRDKPEYQGDWILWPMPRN
jgi:hypothetical protein